MAEQRTSPQRRLFEEQEAETINATVGSVIPGLRYVPNFLTTETHERLLAEVDSQPWLLDLKRKVQHYGFRYDYRSRSVDVSMRLGDLPPWAADVARLLLERGLTDRMPDQLIVNEYEPGQGISNHIDCEPCFDGNVISVSLGSCCVMNFTHKTTGQVVPVLLQPCSAVVLEREARYDWMHGIPPRKSDEFQGRTYKHNRTSRSPFGR